MRVCDECYTVLRDRLCDVDDSCPIRDCHGIVTEIDENMFASFISLNEKGYVTKHCCSAHAFESSPRTYIYFAEHYIFPNLPKGFRSEESHIGDGTVIVKEFRRNMTNADLQKKIWKAAYDVLVWAEKLECNWNETFCAPIVVDTT